MDLASETGLISVLLHSSEIGVLDQAVRYFLQDAGEALATIENQDCQLAVPPLGIAEKLVDGFGKQFGAAPYFALSDE